MSLPVSDAPHLSFRKVRLEEVETVATSVECLVSLLDDKRSSSFLDTMRLRGTVVLAVSGSVFNSCPKREYEWWNQDDFVHLVLEVGCFRLFCRLDWYDELIGPGMES